MVTKVATQGRQDGEWYVKSYYLSYSYDGVFFEDYKEDGVVKVFMITFYTLRQLLCGLLFGLLYTGYRKDKERLSLHTSQWNFRQEFISISVGIFLLLLGWGASPPQGYNEH